MPFAFLPKYGQAIAFTGNLNASLWQFDVGVSAWSSVTISPHPTLSEPGYVLLHDGDSYYFVGHHCNSYNWRDVETNEDCQISSRVYQLAGPAVMSSEQPIDLPPTVGKDAALGGLLTIFPEFCAYDDSTPTCAQRPALPITT